MLYEVITVAESGIDNAVVYIQGGRNAPVGEYPFVPLRHARVVYYRLGPWPAFGLHGEDWRAVHARYFSDRVPYTLGWHGDKIGDRVDARPELLPLAP